MDRKKQEMLDSLRSGRTVVLEKEEETVDPFSRPIPEKQAKASEPKKKEDEKSNALPEVQAEHEDQKKKNKVPRIYQNPEPELVQKPKTIEEALREAEPETDFKDKMSPSVSEKAKALGDYDGEDEPENEGDKEKKEKAKQKTRKVKFRFKIFTIVFCVVAALFGGLGVHNAIKISNLNKEIATQSEYNVNLTKYIYRITNTAKELKEDSTIQEGIVNTSEIPLERRFSSTPEALNEPVEVPQKTNWFSEFIQRIQKIFS